MKTMIRLVTIVLRTALLAACLVTLAGCRGGQTPEDTHDRDEDHAGHVIPAHKPKTFHEAVHRLRELNDQIAHVVVEGQPAAKTLHVALDIANWLPEIAADSDMPETPWNEVNARSAGIVADYQQILSGDSGDARGVVEDANVEIGNLEQLLLASDPRWLGGTSKIAAAPSSGAPDNGRP